MGAIQLVYQATWRENLMFHERTLFGEMLLAPWEWRQELRFAPDASATIIQNRRSGFKARRFQCFQ